MPHKAIGPFLHLSLPRQDPASRSNHAPLSILAPLLSLIPLYKTKNQTLVSTINHPVRVHNMLQVRPTFILGALVAALLVSTAMASRDKTTCNDCQNRLAACAKVRIIT